MKPRLPASMRMPTLHESLSDRMKYATENLLIKLLAGQYGECPQCGQTIDLDSENYHVADTQSQAAHTRDAHVRKSVYHRECPSV